MSDQGEQYQKIWEFGRTENDLDTIVVDYHLQNMAPTDVLNPRPISSVAPAVETPLLALTACPASAPPAETKGNNSSGFEEPSRQPNQPEEPHQQEKKTRKRKPKRSSYKKAADAAFAKLQRHMESLVKEIDTTREDLIAWMHNELKSPSGSKDKSLKPSIPTQIREGQQETMKRKRAPTYVFNHRRSASDPTAEGYEAVPSERGSRSTDEVVVLSKEEEALAAAAAAERKRKLKGKDPISSSADYNQQNNAAAAENYLTLPTVIPQIEPENQGRSALEVENEVLFGNLNNSALNSGLNLGSYIPNSSNPITATQRAVARNNTAGLNPGLNMGRNYGYGNGSAFSTPILPRGSNHAVGMPFVQSQYGLQYLTQSTMIMSSEIFRQPPILSTRSQSFMSGYGALNQQMGYDQGRVFMGPFQSYAQNVARGAFNNNNQGMGMP